MKHHLTILMITLSIGLFGQDDSAAGHCWGGQNGTWFQLDELLQGPANLSWSERIELEISGGTYHTFSQVTYLIEGRGVLEVKGMQSNGVLAGHQLVIYDNGATTNARDKYLIGIRMQSGGWYNVCVRARELNSKSWLTFTSASEPTGLVEVTPEIIWLSSTSANGNVGIGTTTPTEKLSVNGTIRAQEVKVEASPWPDYVFAPNYQLPTIDSLANYIKSNKHLPEVPTAEEVEENGIAVGEMNALLLRKIEELTLYIIDQNKKIAALDSKANSSNASRKKIDELTLHVREQERRIQKLENRYE